MLTSDHSPPRPIEIEQSRKLDDPACWEFLGHDPVRNYSAAWRLHQIVTNPSRYGVAELFIVRRDGAVTGLAVDTPPFPLALPLMDRQALHALTVALADSERQPGGVIGPQNSVRTFCHAWESVTACGWAVTRELQVHAFPKRSPQSRNDVPGGIRAATDADRTMLCDWMRGFAEATSDRSPPVEQLVDRALSQGLMSIWQVGNRPVSVAMALPPVLGAVQLVAGFTPAEDRRCGYQRALLRTLADEAFRKGATACYGVTDVSTTAMPAVVRSLGANVILTMLEASLLGVANSGEDGA